MWLELLSLLSLLSGSPLVATLAAGAPRGDAGDASSGAHNSDASQTLPPAEAGRKSSAALAPGADVPAPRAGGGATSPSGWAGQSLGDEVGAPRDERARKGLLIFVLCVYVKPSTKDTMSMRVRT
jgi:hypothetical protein